ncbi:MAG: hypothetical protein ACQESR_24295, partial [Planctomycetota bacterium]
LIGTRGAVFGGPVQKLVEKEGEGLRGSDGGVFSPPHQLIEPIESDLLVITETVLHTVELNEPAPSFSEPRFGMTCHSKNPPTARKKTFQ